MEMGSVVKVKSVEGRKMGGIWGENRGVRMDE